jgi:hypothetical protein
MKGECGICISDETPNAIRRTKFSKQQDCQDALDSLKNMGVVDDDQVVYKCKVCKMYHFGKPEWVEKFGTK